MINKNDSTFSKSQLTNGNKKNKRQKIKLDENFVAPDGGFAWIICIAAGLSNLCLFSPVQSFGLIFHDKFEQLGISGTQTTTIINIQTAIRSCSGVLYGPMLRKFSYRQVGLIGSFLASVGIFSLSFATSFVEFIGCFSAVFGIGIGMCTGATSYVINSYFKINRRRARSYQLAITSLCQIILPYLVNVMLDNYGVQGTLMCFSAICFHSFAFALTYQPVKWHVQNINIKTNALCDDCQNFLIKEKKPSKKFVSLDKNKCPENLIRRNTLPCIIEELPEKDINFKKSLEEEVQTNLNSEQYNNEHDNTSLKICEKCVEIEKLLNNKDNQTVLKIEMDEQVELKWYQKIIKFFDLDLLNDFTFLNILLGMTLSNFGEQNCHILTAFYLSEFGFSRHQIAIIMSCQAAADIIFRFSIPFCTKKIKWSNQTFFLISIFGLIIARSLISLIPPFEVTIMLAVVIGSLRAFRIIFMGLIIPGYVPLKKLPAAEGLQLTVAGIFTFSCGPFVGLIKDHTNYSFALNILNIFSLATIFLWITEIVYKKWFNKTLIT